MNKDEATKQWIAEYRTRMTRSMSDEEMAREMYDAGQRAERERIATELERITNGSSCEVNSLIAELRGGK